MHADERQQPGGEAPDRSEVPAGQQPAQDDAAPAQEAPVDATSNADGRQANDGNGDTTELEPMKQGDEAREVEGEPQLSHEEAKEVFENVVKVLAEGTDEEVGKRLALADTVLVVQCTDHPDLAYTLYMDREPATAEMGAKDEAEVHIYASAYQVKEFWSGEMHLAMRIARGYITYEGPVRKVLRIIPIARRVTERYREMVGMEPAEDDEVKPTGM